MINHLGRKPVRGGMPARDKNNIVSDSKTKKFEKRVEN
jgi:hypothetical protein